MQLSNLSSGRAIVREIVRDWKVPSLKIVRPCDLFFSPTKRTVHLPKTNV
jgi:hypothetical protein